MERIDEGQLAAELHERRGDPDEWEDTPTEVRVQPTKSEVVSFRLPTSLLTLVEEVVAEREVTLSEFIRNAIVAHLHGVTMEPLVDVHSGSASPLRVVVRTILQAPGHTEAAPAEVRIPDFPPLTVAETH
jgi:hypothetical protein